MTNCRVIGRFVHANASSKNDASAAAKIVKDVLPDVKIDCPMAPKFFDEVSKKCLEDI